MLNELELLKEFEKINNNLIKNYYDILKNCTEEIDYKNHKAIEQIYNISTTIQNLIEKEKQITEKIQIKETELVNEI